MKWADKFFDEAKERNLHCMITNRVHGWPETMVTKRNMYFVKSMTYNISQNLYFQGVDPKKLEEQGNYVLLCGGIKSELRDIFIIPWKDFFQTLKQGEAINTYKMPREYWQSLVSQR